MEIFDSTISSVHADVLDLSPLASAPHLSSLNISSTLVWDLASLEACKEIRTLKLAHSRVRDLSFAPLFPRLRLLDLYGTPVCGAADACLRLVFCARDNIRPGRRSFCGDCDLVHAFVSGAAAEALFLRRSPGPLESQLPVYTRLPPSDLISPGGEH